MWITCVLIGEEPVYDAGSFRYYYIQGCSILNQLMVVHNMRVDK